MNIPSQLELYLAMGELSGQDDDWYSFLDVQGCYSKFYFALKPVVSSCRTPPANQKNENGQTVLEELQVVFETLISFKRC